MKATKKNVARIFADVGGYYVCSDGLDYLDARGYAYRTKAEAMRSAYESGYTHAIGSGAYKQGATIASQIDASELVFNRYGEI